MNRSQDGATAVEFSLLLGPFVVMLIAMIYLGLMHFSNSIFDANVQLVMKRVYEGVPLCPGQPSTAPYSAACLAQRICEQPAPVMISAAKCQASIKVDLRVLNGDSSDTFPAMFTASGPNPAGFSPGQGGTPGTILMVRAAVPFPTLMAFGPYITKGGGFFYLTAAQATRVRNLTNYNNVRVN